MAKRYKSFKELVNFIEGSLQGGYTVLDVHLTPGEIKNFNIEGTDIIIPRLLNAELFAQFKFSLAMNNGKQAGDWIREDATEVTDIRNFPFYKFSIRNDQVIQGNLRIYIFTNPRLVSQLQGVSND